MSGPMVRALLEGRKKQTRRLATSPLRRCDVGDRLWIRETFATPFKRTEHSSGAIYRADGPEYLSLGAQAHQWGAEARWTPSIHMPRWASRITLEVTAVRIQRLHELTDDDAIAEGVVPWMPLDSDKIQGWHVPHVPHPGADFRRILGAESLIRATPREMYAALWDVLHGSGAWLSDPYVVALTFKVLK